MDDITKAHVESKQARENIDAVLNSVPEIDRDSFWPLLMEWKNAEDDLREAWRNRD